MRLERIVPNPVTITVVVDQSEIDLLNALDRDASEAVAMGIGLMLVTGPRSSRERSRETAAAAARCSDVQTAEMFARNEANKKRVAEAAVAAAAAGAE